MLSRARIWETRDRDATPLDVRFRGARIDLCIDPVKPGPGPGLSILNPHDIVYWDLGIGYRVRSARSPSPVPCRPSPSTPVSCLFLFLVFWCSGVLVFWSNSSRRGTHVAPSHLIAIGTRDLRGLRLSGHCAVRFVPDLRRCTWKDVKGFDALARASQTHTVYCPRKGIFLCG